MIETQKKLVNPKRSENRSEKANSGLELALFSEKIGICSINRRNVICPIDHEIPP